MSTNQEECLVIKCITESFKYHSLGHKFLLNEIIHCCLMQIEGKNSERFASKPPLPQSPSFHTLESR